MNVYAPTGLPQREYYLAKIQSLKNILVDHDADQNISKSRRRQRRRTYVREIERYRQQLMWLEKTISNKVSCKMRKVAPKFMIFHTISSKIDFN